MERVLAGDVEESGGDLPELLPHRVAVLAQDHDPVLLVQGEDGDRAGVDLVVAVGDRPVRHPDGVGAHRGLDAPERGDALDDRPVLGGVGEAPVAGRRGAVGAGGEGGGAHVPCSVRASSGRSARWCGSAPGHGPRRSVPRQR